MANEAKSMERARVEKIFAEAVKAIINGDKNHGWGQADSLAVIDDLLANSLDEIAKAKSATPEMLEAIGEVVNPSAFRQKLESAKLLNKSEGRKAKHAGFMAGLTE